MSSLHGCDARAATSAESAAWTELYSTRLCRVKDCLLSIESVAELDGGRPACWQTSR